MLRSTVGCLNSDKGVRASTDIYYKSISQKTQWATREKYIDAETQQNKCDMKDELEKKKTKTLIRNKKTNRYTFTDI